jgi:hypothetical protein
MAAEISLFRRLGFFKRQFFQQKIGYNFPEALIFHPQITVPAWSFCMFSVTVIVLGQRWQHRNPLGLLSPSMERHHANPKSFANLPLGLPTIFQFTGVSEFCSYFFGSMSLHASSGAGVLSSGSLKQDPIGRWIFQAPKNEKSKVLFRDILSYIAIAYGYNLGSNLCVFKVVIL